MESITEPHPSSSNSNYAFITHSQETLPRNLPPSIDNATLARRRRRRTSVHDQAILEEEYRKCDRPDKTKRKEITSRVQMGEKEVQIWFQNKRQSARRKAKPLLPHEIIPNNNSSSQYSIQVIPSSQYSSFDNSQSFSSSQREVTTSFNSDVHHRRRTSVSSDCPSPPLADAFSSDVSASQGSGAYPGHSDADDDEEPEDDHQQQRYQPLSQGKRQKLSLNREHQSSPTSSPRHETTFSQQQNHISLNNYELPEPEMTTSAHQRLQDVLSTPSQPIKSASSRRTNPTAHQPPRLLKRSSSIRLSTSLEGKATVVLDEEPESPPPSQTLPTPKQPIPSSVGRSTGPKRKIIDSKIWEFYCDNQAMIRSPAQPKIQPAEAKQALGLLRKKSNASSKLPSYDIVSSPITQKKLDSSHRKTIHSSPTKAKKSRKIISQKSSRPKPVSVDQRKSHVSTKKLVDNDSISLELSQESDKENRPPGAPVSPPPEPRRRLGVSGKGGVGSAKKSLDKKSRKKKRHTGDGRRILGEHKSIPSQTAGASVFHDIPSSSQYLEEQDEPVEEVVESSQQSFYFESSQESAISILPPARVDEMECVENLLSLRAGTWKWT